MIVCSGTGCFLNSLEDVNYVRLNGQLDIQMLVEIPMSLLSYLVMQLSKPMSQSASG
jgi:hypothetical protein